MKPKPGDAVEIWWVDASGRKEWAGENEKQLGVVVFRTVGIFIEVNKAFINYVGTTGKTSEGQWTGYDETAIPMGCVIGYRKLDGKQPWVHP